MIELYQNDISVCAQKVRLVLVNDGAIITKSNVISYCFEEVFEQNAVINFCLACRQQILTRYATDEVLESLLNNYS